MTIDFLNKNNNLTDIAPKGKATQSSLSKWSKKDDAQRAVLNVESDFAFHTDLEDKPWWQVELDSVYPIEYILIHNRKRTQFQNKSKFLKVEISLDNKNWKTVYAGGCVFGAEPEGIPLILPFQNSEYAMEIRGQVIMIT